MFVTAGNFAYEFLETEREGVRAKILQLRTYSPPLSLSCSFSLHLTSPPPPSVASSHDSTQ